MSRGLLRRTAEGASEGFVVCPNGKRAPLEDVPEVLHGEEDTQQLPVKGGVLGLSGGEFLRKECHRGTSDTTAGEDGTDGDR